MPVQFKVPDDIAVRVPADLMSRVVVGIFRALEMPEADAARCAETLLDADLRGIDSHGVSNMFPAYVGGLQQGFVNPAPVMKTLQEGPSALVFDSDRGLGLTIGPQAMAAAMDKAEATGVGTAVVTNGRHYGAAAYHAQLALERDMIGLSMTVGGLAVTPTFGAKAMLGLNPIAVAAPARSEPPFVFDASMSSVAANKIALARRLGATVPGGWLAGTDGAPIMEEGPVPDEFLMLPLGATREIGSHKGYGLAAIVDILAGMLGGDPPGFERTPGDVSHHFSAWRISAFTDVDGFVERMDRFLSGLRRTPTAPGEERVLYPGLPEHETLLERSERGIPYHPAVVEYFRKTAGELGVDHGL